MRINTEKLEPTEVLFGLYDYAFNHLVTNGTIQKVSSLNTQDTEHTENTENTENTEKNSSAVFTIKDAKDVILRQRPNLFFKEITFGGYSVFLNVLLLNPDEFDAVDYDYLYGEGAALNAMRIISLNHLPSLEFLDADTKISVSPAPSLLTSFKNSLKCCICFDTAASVKPNARTSTSPMSYM